jgi:flagellar hook-basal body complex protein FliE
MQIDAIRNSIPNPLDPAKIEGNSGGDNFGNMLTDFIGEVNQSQLNANAAAKEFVTGGNIQIQDVMIAGEKAKTSLELLMEIRNQAVDMYKQLNNIQI